MGRDPAGLDSPLDKVTVAGETRGVDRLREGDARADRGGKELAMPPPTRKAGDKFDLRPPPPAAAGDMAVRKPGDKLLRRPGDRLLRMPGDKLLRMPGERLFLCTRDEASTATLLILPPPVVLPFVAATLLLFSVPTPPPPPPVAPFPPPGGGPLSDNNERHFLTNDFARLAKYLSLDLRLTSFICLPSRVA